METLDKFKPGDRAIVVHSMHSARTGKYVTILDIDEDVLIVLYDDYIGTTMEYPGGIRGKVCRGHVDNYEPLIREVVGLVTHIYTNKICTVKIIDGEFGVLHNNIMYVTHNGGALIVNQTVHLKGYSRKAYFFAMEIL